MVWQNEINILNLIISFINKQIIILILFIYYNLRIINLNNLIDQINQIKEETTNKHENESKKNNR